MFAERPEAKASAKPDVTGPPSSSIDVAPPPLPAIDIRGRSFLALVVAPGVPLNDWLAALDHQIKHAPDLFSDRPVVADLGAIGVGGVQPSPYTQALDALAARNLKLVGVEGVEPDHLLNTPWARLPTALRSRDSPAGRGTSPGPSASKPASHCLVVDCSVRSGQSILCEDGDVTVIGAVASGAEVIAGGSIHVYGPLRGRAIAGIRADASARIFCRTLDAELVAIGGIYRTGEDLGADVQGRAAQIRCEGRALRLTALE